MKTVGFWLLKSLLRSLARGLRQRIDTPAERRSVAEKIVDANRERLVGHLEKLLAKGDAALDQIDGEES